MEEELLVGGAVAMAWVLVSALAGLTVGRQLRGMGLQDPEDGIRWTRVIATLSGWLLLLAGLAGTTHLTGLGLLSGLLLEAFGVLLPLLPAAVVMAAATRWARDRRRDGDPTAATEARWATIAGGVAAALLVTQAGAFGTLLLLILLAVGAWLATDATARTRAVDAWQQLQAGSRLRQVLRPDTVLRRDGRDVLVMGPVGLLATDVLVDGEAQVLPNRELLLLVPPALARST